MQPTIRPGETFGMLTAIERVGTDRHSRSTWLLGCQCGGTVVRSSLNLRQAKAHNCGCYRPQNFVKGQVGICRTHGRSETRLYEIWISMKQRCGNARNRAYGNYGGRGIYVCEEWLSFPAFERWAVAAGHEEGLDIDRTDNDGPYSPENCRVVSREINMGNTRVAVCHTYFGERLPLKAASRKFGLDTKTIRRRIAKGLSPEQAVLFQGRLSSPKASDKQP